jgi:hypothetical protein
MEVQFVRGVKMSESMAQKVAEVAKKRGVKLTAHAPYFINLNARVDGSSKFSPEYQYGFFPGISAGWNIANGSFMEASGGGLNQLKIRVGYGETGNDDIEPAYTDWYSPGAEIMWGNNILSGIRLAGIGNPDLRWEKQTEINAGIDFALYQNRIFGSIEYFDRKISRILGEKPIVSYNPISYINANLDAIKQSYGTEFTLNTRNIEATGNGFSWNSNFTVTYYRDRWLKRDPNYQYKIYETEKQFFNELWYYKTEGLVPIDADDPWHPIPGTVNIRDVNGYLTDENGDRVFDEKGKPLYSGEPDGVINDADLIKIGVNIPITIGFINQFSYRNFDLSIHTYGVFNQWKRNDTYHRMFGKAHMIVDPTSNIGRITLDRWNSDNLDGTQPSSCQEFAPYGQYTTGTWYLEKAWFIRVQDITLGYTLPEMGRIRQMRVYFDLINPFLITPFTGMDPETDNYSGSYPNQRTYILGINISF